MNKEEIINKLYDNQIKDIEPKYRLNSKDIIRLSSYISGDPFSETECCQWKGAISTSSHQSKYINFWFNKKKQALHRILYLNYKGPLHKNKYLRFSCPNQHMRGVCCNINHLDLINKDDIEENNNNELEVISKIKKSISTKTKVNNDINTSTTLLTNNYNKNVFVIVFED